MSETSDDMAAREDIETLTLAADRLGLRGMHHRLQRLAEAPSIDRLAALVRDARGFSRLTGHGTGADALANAIAPQLHAARAVVAADVPSADSVQTLSRLTLAPSDDLGAAE